MIKKVDIKKFGLFFDYNWNSEIGSDPTKDVFKKVNIIYGRNYSGKTTLSRIFRCVESGELHEDYEDAEFTISTDDDTINQSNLSYSKQIRVYNTDFVKKKLSWLHDNDEGKIEPFTLLSMGDPEIEKSIEYLEKNINDIDIKLGTINEETGSFEEDTLYFKQSKKKTEVSNANDNLSNLETDLARRIKAKANDDIKKNSILHNQKHNYDIRNIQAEIDDIRNNNLNCLLTEKEIELQKSIITEMEKNKTSSLSPLYLDFTPHIDNAKTSLIKEIKISKKISENIEQDLLNWLKLGCRLHKETDICEFCQSPISTHRRDELEAFFNKESEELERNIDKEIKDLELLKIKILNYMSDLNLTKDNFYVALHYKFDAIKLKWDKAVEDMTGQVDLLKDSLSKRLEDLYTPIIDVNFERIETNTIDFNPIIEEFNNLILENNGKSNKIEKEKDNAREKLRYHTIKKFLTDINYDALLESIEKAKIKKKETETEYEKMKDAVSEKEKQKEDIQKQIDELKTKLNDQSAGAEKINEHLRNFFGHDSIQLKPSEQQIADKVVTRFVVKRGNDEAKNLSEGECSLVAFCYFMARIENEIQDTDAKKKLIIYIDDPISSLDNNHIFFIFGLIESVIAKSKKFNQLFISTHNLEFLRYLKRLTVPNDEIIDEEGKKKSQKSWSHYLIYKNKNKSISQSHIRYMPKYLSSYTTEYNFLFSQIYEMAMPKHNKVSLYENQFSLLYNLPNNMRKFLECFLFYKYPDTDNPLHFYLSKLFDGAVHPKINRIINEYSHLTWGERGTIPTDVAEAEETARLILKAIKDKDPEHYEALCKSIKVNPNIEL